MGLFIGMQMLMFAEVRLRVRYGALQARSLGKCSVIPYRKTPRYLFLFLQERWVQIFPNRVVYAHVLVTA